MVTGFHGFYLSIGVIYLAIAAIKMLKGHYDERGYAIVKIAGLY